MPQSESRRRWRRRPPATAEQRSAAPGEPAERPDRHASPNRHLARAQPTAPPRAAPPSAAAPSSRRIPSAAGPQRAEGLCGRRFPRATVARPRRHDEARRRGDEGATLESPSDRSARRVRGAGCARAPAPRAPGGRRLRELPVLRARVLSRGRRIALAVSVLARRCSSAASAAFDVRDQRLPHLRRRAVGQVDVVRQEAEEMAASLDERSTRAPCRMAGAPSSRATSAARHRRRGRPPSRTRPGRAAARWRRRGPTSRLWIGRRGHARARASRPTSWSPRPSPWVARRRSCGASRGVCATAPSSCGLAFDAEARWRRWLPTSTRPSATRASTTASPWSRARLRSPRATTAQVTSTALGAPVSSTELLLGEADGKVVIVARPRRGRAHRRRRGRRAVAATR